MTSNLLAFASLGERSDAPIIRELQGTFMMRSRYYIQ